ncbi:hypothetical protein SAMN05421679_1211 [Epilithonimonas pallida]|uniref:Uncharacterized protein n=1 Tax=Epilithonimonas pallida TaxID=373671 RepID=A0ABY1R6T6_9FLAO|nr:hypothetical protein SAMN05421679_1211 [Epilithonimonas pallida]
MITLINNTVRRSKKSFLPNNLQIFDKLNLLIVGDKQTSHIPIVAKSLFMGKRITESKKQSVEHILLEQPRIETRQLYYLLKNKFSLEKIKNRQRCTFRLYQKRKSTYLS